MMQESYVSFEIAKLLKEKGFDWECIGYYVDYEPEDVKYSFLGETNSVWENRCYSAPTIQMTMRWLREIHGLHIMVNCIGEVNYDPIVQSFDGKDFEIEGVVFTTQKYIDGEYVDVRRGFKTNELACEAAIKYCIENLI